MEIKYPVSKTSIDDMCEIIKFFELKFIENTDCTTLYEVTFDQLRTIYNLGKDYRKPVIVDPAADANEMNDLHGERYGIDWAYPSKETEMNKELIERLAKEVFEHLGSCRSEQHAIGMCSMFLARYLAERGKEAVGIVQDNPDDNGNRNAWGMLYDETIPNETLLFLAPQIPEGICEIFVGNGLFAICDAADFEKVKGAWWHLVGKDRKTQYAQTRFTGSRKLVSMHRLILDAQDGAVVDHINGNGLDNRRTNLRICTVQQNTMNMMPKGTGSSRFKGVSLMPSGKWRSYIRADGKRRHVGYFNNEVDAAKAYNDAAIEYFGEFARLNDVLAAAGVAPSNSTTVPTKQITAAKLHGDQGVTLTFTSCRAAEEFLLKVKP